MKLRLLTFLCIVLFSGMAWGATIYVDADPAADCSGDYSIAGRACSGADGDSYQIVADGITNLSAGATLNIRAGTYNESGMLVNETGPAMTTIQAYNGESVTVHSSTMESVFKIHATADDVTFKDLIITGVIYLDLPDFDNHAGNVWKKTGVASEPSRIRFDTVDVASPEAALVNVDAANEWFWDTATDILYVYSVGDPDTTYVAPGINETNQFDAFGIGVTSGGEGNLIVVDNCEISNFSHAAIKGGHRFWVKNCYIHDIGWDTQQHGIYIFGAQTVGNESIFEYNYLKDISGSGFQIYNSGIVQDGYGIYRYNILNGCGRSGFELAMANNLIYNNTIYACVRGVRFVRSPAYDNTIKNNIFYGNSTADMQIDYGGDPQVSFPGENTVEYNLLASATISSGLADYSTQIGITVSDATNFSISETVTGADSNATGTLATISTLRFKLTGVSGVFQDGEVVSSVGGGSATISSLTVGGNALLWDDDPLNVVSTDNPFGAAFSVFSDFILPSGSNGVGMGANLGASHDDGLDPHDTAWPPSTIDQDDHGAWEAGAFIFRGGAQLGSGAPVSIGSGAPAVFY